MKIAVDYHDTLADLKSPVLAALNARFGTSLTRDDIVEWRFWEGQPFSKRDFYEAVDEAKNSGLTPIPGAVDGLRALVNAGNDVAVVSGTRDPQGIARWLARHKLPELDVVAVYSRDASARKLTLGFDYYIDDNPAMAGDERVLIFDQPWNRHVAGFRVTSWDHARSVLA